MAVFPDWPACPLFNGQLVRGVVYRRADPAYTTLFRGRALVSYPCYFRASCDDRGDLRPTDVPANQPVVEKPVCDDGHHLYCLYGRLSAIDQMAWL